MTRKMNKENKKETIMYTKRRKKKEKMFKYDIKRNTYIAFRKRNRLKSKTAAGSVNVCSSATINAVKTKPGLSCIEHFLDNLLSGRSRTLAMRHLTNAPLNFHSQVISGFIEIQWVWY